MEHEYRSPESTNLDLYFELIQGFVYALDGSIHMLAHDTEMDFVTQDDTDDTIRSKLGLKVEYLVGTDWGYKTTKHFWRGDQCTEHVIGKK